MSKLRTTIEIGSGLTDYEVEIEVEYRFLPGCAATLEGPAEEASVDFNEITVIETDGTRHKADWLLSLLEFDEEIQCLCLLDWQEAQAYAAEQRADMIRDDRLMDEF